MATMSDVGALQQQIEEVREALRQARGLVGTNLTAPPTAIEADPQVAQKWVV